MACPAGTSEAAASRQIVSWNNILGLYLPLLFYFMCAISVLTRLKSLFSQKPRDPSPLSVKTQEHRITTSFSTEATQEQLSLLKY
jgi:hypothetical protein